MAPDTAVRRRELLAGATGALAATSGCIGELRNLAGRERTDQLSLRISTTPAGDDPYAIQIANHVADNLADSGIETTVDAMGPDVLRREILVNHDFDIYVTRYPSQGTPDELRSMLYSAYGEESGWQNPFGISDLGLDELLDEQRTVDGEARAETIAEIQRQLVRDQPFTTVAFPDRIGAVRSDRFDGWPAGGIGEPTDYLRLTRVGESPSLRAALRGDRITRNRNPIVAEYRDQGALIGLLYEPLFRSVEGSETPVPWLARGIEFDDDDPAVATVRLRRTPWHDGEAVTARDVAFTYEFLKDTSLGEFDTPVPTPWRRGRVSLVEDVSVHSEGQLRIEFTTENRSLAYRALDVNVLPEHVWRERSEAASLAGIDIVGQTTEALVSANEEPVGSGPVRFEEASPGESLSLVRFDDHFLHGGDTDGIPPRIAGAAAFDRIEFTTTPSAEAAVRLLAEDESDGVADGLQASAVPSIVRAEGVSLTLDESDAFYHVGYNCRRSPLADPRFRRAIAGHLDRAFVVDELLGGYGRPSELPLKGQWAPAELEWDGEASVPFLGDAGAIDIERARQAFRDAGYQYDDDELITRGGS